MNNAAWLSRGFVVRKEVMRLERARDDALKEIAYPSAFRETIVSGGNMNSTESKVIAYTQIAQDYDRELSRLAQIQLEIERAIYSLPPCKDRVLLAYRFLDYKSIEQIRELVGHTEYNSTQRAIVRAAERLKIQKSKSKKRP